MRDLVDLDHAFDEKTGVCRAIIETPRGARDKFDFDRETGLFKLKRTLPEGMSFPLDFGFIPSTLAEDGDPVDVMVFTEASTFPGALIDVRLIGAIEAKQTEQGKTLRNDRLLAVAMVGGRYAKARSPADLPKELIEQLVRFWVNKDALEGRIFEPLGVSDARAAADLLRKTTRVVAKKR